MNTNIKFDLQLLKNVADNHRDSIAPNSNFGIRELLKKPIFFDWVKCQPDEKNIFQMFLAGGDVGVAMRFYWNGSYERATLSLWSKLAETNGIIIDIGAHTGVYSLTALSRKLGAKVLSFEPHFMNFSRLNLNLRGNNYSTNGTYMIGIGERNEVLPFSVTPNLSYLSSGGGIGAKDNSIVSNIQVVALDKFLPQEISSEVSLIKIDVEGYEGACLRGMISLIAKSRPIIFLECIEAVLGKDVSYILQSLGYYFCMIDDSSGQISNVDSIKPMLNHLGELNKSCLNRVALPNKELLDFVLSNSL